MQHTGVLVHIRRPWHNVLQGEHTPLRSRLYSLVPYEIGTIWCESLTGYINRLGWSHHVSACAFAAEVIISQIDVQQTWCTPPSVFGNKRDISLHVAGAIDNGWAR